MLIFVPSEKQLCHPERSRRTPCSRTPATASKGVRPLQCWECLFRLVVKLASWGPSTSLRMTIY